MSRLWKGIWIAGALAVLAVLTLIVWRFTGFNWPIHSEATLKAIKADAQILMDAKSAKNDHFPPENQWPPAIASLKPTFVVVSPDTVDVVATPFFDGGWGYRVMRNKREAPQPAGRFFALGHGVYWFHPY